MGGHASIVGLRELEGLDPLPDRLTWWLTDKALWAMHELYGGVRVELEEVPELTAPVIFAMNHSHYYDFMPSRRALWTHLGIKTVSFVKARAYQHRLDSLFVTSIGNIPIVSRGYLICADFARVHGRKPGEDEYRRLREHIDHGAALPDEPIYRALQTRRRSMLDLPFDPAASSYRAGLERCYAAGMAGTLAHARRAVAAGVHLHIYPEGLYSTRLSRGRIGAVQFALALDLPIVPVGFCGMNELFAARAMVPRRPGVLRMRFGEPRRVASSAFPGFRPFVPSEERRLRGALERETEGLMVAINELLEPAYRWGEELDGDGLEGVGRFFD